MLLTRYDRTRGQEEIIRVATKTRQQYAVRLATLRLAAYDLSQCKTLEEISQQRERLNWFLSEASPLNPRTKEALRILDEVIRDIGAATSTLSDYTRQQGFQRTRTRLEDFQTQFVPTGLKGREVIEFNKVAQVWIGIIKQELDRLVEVRVYEKIPNPYVAGKPVQPEDRVFVGRMEVFRFIEENLTDVSVPPTLVIYGQRRVGKSSILTNLGRYLPANFIPVAIDMDGAASVESTYALLYNIGEGIYKTLESRYGFKITSKSKTEYKDEPFIVFAQFLESVEKVLANRDRKDSFTRLLLSLDEFERIDVKIKEGVFSSDILKFLRNIMQHHPRILLLFTGYHTIEEMSGDYWSVFFGSTRQIKISYLDEKSARGLIISPIPGFPLKYDQQAVERIISATRCQPYLLQNTCFNIVLHLNHEQRYQATLEDVNKALEKTLSDLEAFFQGFVWGLADTPLAKVVLFLLSKGRKGLDELEKEIEMSGIKTTRGELLTILKKLKQRDLVEQTEDGLWGFQVELAQQWVVKNKSMAEALG